jgi:uridine kinase
MKGAPLFLLGLLIRVAFVAAVLPWTHEHWFVPFLGHIPQAHTVDIWSDFMAAGGDARAFPYGLPYILVFGPLTALGSMIFGEAGAALGLGRQHHRQRLMLLYWLSPITLYIGYWHGQLDLLPTLILTLSLLAMKRNQGLLSGLLMGLAISAKLSMVVAVPFAIIYLVGSPRHRNLTGPYLAAIAGMVALTLAPLVIFEGFRTMVLGTPELQKGVALAIDYGEGLTLYVLPMVYAGVVFIAWRIRRLSFDELVCLIGVAFLALYMLTPASPGWAMWFAAFLAVHTAQSGLRAGLLFLLLNISFVALHLLISTGARLSFGDQLNMGLINLLDPGMAMKISGWIFSLLAVVVGAIIVQMLRERVFNNNFHLSTRRPLMIGIAGDSGAGKDTLSELIVGMFGSRATCALSGDDYHAWDRHKPMWRALTHLSPKANDLERFAADALELGGRRAVRSPHYDHHVGRMTKPRLVEPREVVIISGLHALYTPALNARYDLSVFLDMHEGLRRYLKVRRDVSVRGHPLEKVLGSMESRYPDSRRYILPQRANAGLVISLEPVNPADVEDFNRRPETIQLRLRINSRRGDDMRRLETLLVSMCGLHVLETTDEETGVVEVLIEGAPSAEQVAIVARELAPHFEEHLSLAPEWKGGQHGLLQLLVLDQLDRARASYGGVV